MPFKKKEVVEPIKTTKEPLKTNTDVNIEEAVNTFNVELDRITSAMKMFYEEMESQMKVHAQPEETTVKCSYAMKLIKDTLGQYWK